jgi:hypothetical protein
MIGKIESIEENEYCNKIKSCIMETNSVKSKGWFSGWRFWGMECEKGTISGNLIQKIWWWISRKEVKLKFVVEMDEAELDDIIREILEWKAEIPTKESVGSPKPERKTGNKQSKGRGKQKGKAVRSSAKGSSKKGKKV